MFVGKEIIMSRKKRAKTVRMFINVDNEMDTDLKILYGLRKEGMRKESGEVLYWNDFINDVFMEYISRNSDKVKIVRTALMVGDIVDEEGKGV
jgi:hypothetical protein